MKCINCKKEILEGNIYCVHCGEKLVNINETETEYNYSIDNQKIYDEFGNKAAEYGTSVKNNLPGYYEKLKNFAAKNKIATIIGSIFIIAIICGISVFSFMQGSPVKESQLQNYLIGENLIIDGSPYEIKDGQIKSLQITSRNSVKKQSDKIEGVVTLDLDNATVISNVKFELAYNKSSNKWSFSGLTSSNITSIEPKVDLNDSIKDLLKNTTINYNYNNIDLTKGLLKDIENIEINGTGENRDGTAVLSLSNGVVDAKVSASFRAHFDLKEGKWMLNSNNLQSKIVEKEKISPNLSDEDKKKFVLTAFENNRSYNYKYKIGNSDYSENIVINQGDISDLKVNNFMEYTDDTIRAEIEGQAANGDVSKIKFSGVVYLNLSLNTSVNNKTEVNVDSVELNNINPDIIKKSMLEFKIENKPITVAVADTFNLGNEDKDSRMFDKIYDGTITIDGVVKNIKTRMYINYNDKDKKYEWKLEGIDVIKN